MGFPFNHLLMKKSKVNFRCRMKVITPPRWHRTKEIYGQWLPPMRNKAHHHAFSGTNALEHWVMQMLNGPRAGASPFLTVFICICTFNPSRRCVFRGPPGQKYRRSQVKSVLHKLYKLIPKLQLSVNSFPDWHLKSRKCHTCTVTGLIFSVNCCLWFSKT